MRVIDRQALRAAAQVLRDRLDAHPGDPWHVGAFLEGHRSMIDDAIAGRITEPVDYRVNAEKALDGAMQGYPGLGNAYYAFIEELRGRDGQAR